MFKKKYSNRPKKIKLTTGDQPRDQKKEKARPRKTSRNKRESQEYQTSQNQERGWLGGTSRNQVRGWSGETSRNQERGWPGETSRNQETKRKRPKRTRPRKTSWKPPKSFFFKKKGSDQKQRDQSAKRVIKRTRETTWNQETKREGPTEEGRVTERS